MVMAGGTRLIRESGRAAISDPLTHVAVRRAGLSMSQNGAMRVVARREIGPEWAILGIYSYFTDWIRGLVSLLSGSIFLLGV